MITVAYDYLLILIFALNLHIKHIERKYSVKYIHKNISSGFLFFYIEAFVCIFESHEFFEFEYWAENGSII